MNMADLRRRERLGETREREEREGRKELERSEGRNCWHFSQVWSDGQGAGGGGRAAVDLKKS